MENIQIDLKEFQENAQLFGFVSRFVGEYFDSLGPEAPYSPAALGIFASSFVLPDEISSDEANSMVFGMMDVCNSRSTEALGGELTLPEWDPEIGHYKNSFGLTDVFFIYYAFVLASKGKKPQKNYMGPILSLSGLALETIGEAFEKGEGLTEEKIQEFKKTLFDYFSKIPDFREKAAAELTNLEIATHLEIIVPSDSNLS